MCHERNTANELDCYALTCYALTCDISEIRGRRRNIRPYHDVDTSLEAPRTEEERANVSERLNIRKAKADDFTDVRFLAEVLAAHIDEPPPPLTVERYLDFYIDGDAPMQLFVAVRGATVVGMIAWVLTHELYSGGTTVFISDIAVRPD